MPIFTPPTVLQGSADPFFGRYSVPVGQSVVKKNGHYVTTPYPWLGDLAPLTEGADYFLGGRTYIVSDAVGTALEADGYTVDGYPGFGQGAYGFGQFGA